MDQTYLTTVLYLVHFTDIKQ